MGGVVAVLPAQREALGVLSKVLDERYYLAGGVAVAVRAGHRLSHDLDLFTASADPEALLSALPAQAVVVMSRAPGTLQLEIGGVPVSVLTYRHPELAPPDAGGDLGVQLASIDDLTAMKLSAIGGRGARRDFWDLHELLRLGGASLDDALRLFERKYPNVDKGYVVRALSYFDDAEAEPMPRGLDADSWGEIREALRRAVLRLGT